MSSESKRKRPREEEKDEKEEPPRKKQKRRLCKHPSGCSIRPTYGVAGGSSRKDAEYCVTHAPIEYVDVINKKCKHPAGCSKHPTYGPATGSRKDAAYCITHAPTGYVDVVSKRCKHPGCSKQPTYGPIGGRSKKDAIYCVTHAPTGYINVAHKKCKHPLGCSTRPTYGPTGGSGKDAAYCATHAPTGYVVVANKQCKHPSGCSTRPTYGPTGGSKKDATYCATHAPTGYVNVTNKKCKHPSGCSRIPAYGPAGGTRKDGEYCTTHAPTGYVDVVNKKCKHPSGCLKQPSYGPVGGSSKDAGYCRKHTPTDYIDVVSKRCHYPECTARAHYGCLFGDIKHCSRHKSPNETRKTRPKCTHADCKEQPMWTDASDNNPQRCNIHKKDEDKNVVERKCEGCGLEWYIKEGNLCNDCSDFAKAKPKRREAEMRIRVVLTEAGFKLAEVDQPIQGGCSRRRPDIVIRLPFITIIIEIDEHQHRRTQYGCDCEQGRMITLFQDEGGSKTAFVRYNPDSYVDKDGKRHGKNTKQASREKRLVQAIRGLIHHPPKAMLSAAYLYYDGDDGLNHVTQIDYENNRTSEDMSV
jgi:hypothetical protein